jgi:hypothetical protein
MMVELWDRQDLSAEERRAAFDAAVREAQKPDPATHRSPTAQQIARKLKVRKSRVEASRAFYDHPWLP